MLGVQRLDDQLREVVPGADLRQAGKALGGKARHDALDAQLVRATGRTSARLGQSEHGTGARGAGVRARQSLAQHREVLARVDVEQQRGRALDSIAGAGCRASAVWRSQLSGPKLGGIASGGVSSSPLVPVPWRSGTITTAGASGAFSSASSSAGSSAGQSPGTHRTRSNPSASARATPSATAALWPSSAVSSTTSAPSRRAAAATESSRVTTIVRCDRGGFAERAEHVADHRPRQLVS